MTITRSDCSVFNHKPDQERKYTLSVKQDWEKSPGYPPKGDCSVKMDEAIDHPGLEKMRIHLKINF